jgi:hypothetical protein
VTGSIEQENNMTDLTIPDDLSIPKFLDLKIPANHTAWKEGHKIWTPRKVKAEAKAKINRDSEGRSLPKNMDETSWAFLRAQEKETKAEVEADKAERFRFLEALRQEKARVKAAAKAVKHAI